MIERLSGRRAFTRLQAEGVRVGRGPIRLVVRPDPDQMPRFAYAIPRSVGNAVSRNRIKRRIRAALQELENTGARVSGGDYLIRVTAPINEWDHPRLLSVMHDVLALPTASSGPPTSRDVR